jgi:uncharacterized protein (AIM24 family)
LENFIAIDLDEVGGRMICQREAFLCAAQLGIAFQCKLGAGFFGGKGLFFATVRGPGSVWPQSLPFSRLGSRGLNYTAVDQTDNVTVQRLSQGQAFVG